MAILSSRNGKFYEVPDKDLGKYELPAEKVKEVLGGMEPGGEGDVEPYGAPAQIVIHVNGAGATVEGGPEPEGEGVQPYGYYGGYGGYYAPPYWGWRRRRRRYHYYYGY